MKKRLAMTGLILTAFLAACNFSLAEDITPPPNYVSPTPAPTVGALFPSAKPSPARGQAIYERECAACHGTEGLGNGPQSGDLAVPVSAIGLRDIASQSNPASWYTIITQGQMDKSMPPFSNLSSPERWDVLAYVYTLSNPSNQVAQGADLFASQCATCHGPTGNGSGGQTTGVQVDLTDPAFTSQLTGLGMFQVIANGISPQMPAFTTRLNEDEMWALTAYLRTLYYETNPVRAQTSPTATGLTVTGSSIGNTTPEETSNASGDNATTTPASTQNGGVENLSTPAGTETPANLTAEISGEIINGSGGEIPTDLSIELHAYLNMEETATLSIPVKKDGSFQFKDVPLEANMAFIISTTFEGTTYNSDVAVYDGSTNSFALPLTIYDTITETSSITTDRLHIFLDFSNPGLVQVIEIYILSNSSNKAVVSSGPGQAVQTYTLPESASNLKFENGEIGNPYISTKDGFGDPTSILPGASSYQMLFAFDLPYAKKLEIKQPFNVPINSVIIMVPAGIKVGSDTLVDGGTRDVQGQSYSLFSTENLAKGDSLTFTVSGTPKTSTSTTAGSNNSTQTSLVIGLGVFGLVLILAGGFFFFRSRTHQRTTEEDPEEIKDDPLGNDADSLMDAIASLDDQFKAGGLGEEAYLERRKELKDRLKAVL
jgi:mono/diheme cytochrome c family protein